MSPDNTTGGSVSLQPPFGMPVSHVRHRVKQSFRYIYIYKALSADLRKIFPPNQKFL